MSCCRAVISPERPPAGEKTTVVHDPQSGRTFPIDGGFGVQAAKAMNYEYLFVNNIFDINNQQMADQYRIYGRCFSIVDKNVDDLYGDKMSAYFEHHGIPLTKYVVNFSENEKTMRTLESMIDAMQDFGLNRQEPVCIYGGGLVTDVGGFACSMLRRNTPYVRVPTTLVGLIDASIAIKVAVNHADGKNKLGAFHAHQAVLLDCSFLATVPDKEMRVGIAELIKIAVVEEKRTFDLLYDHCEEMMSTKFGYVNPEGKYSEKEMENLRLVGQEIIERGIYRMLELESSNLHELNLDRAIAYGHTWSPELELANKYRDEACSIMHGHGVGMDMALSATLACNRGLISEEDRDKIHSVISRVGLMLDHPVQWDSDLMARATDEITKTRNGLLRAAVPSGELGRCEYLNDVSHEELMSAVADHKAICEKLPREGRGIDYLVPPKQERDYRFVVTPNDAIAVQMEKALAEGRAYKEVDAGISKAKAMVDGVDAMVNAYSAQPSEALVAAAASTASVDWAAKKEAGDTNALMEAEMISGQAEAQFLQLLAKFGGAKRCLDVGSFTGYSALAMAEALPEDGVVVGIEWEADVAAIAQKNLDASPAGKKVDLRVGDAKKVLSEMVNDDAVEPFDMIFVDAYKPDYVEYYNAIMDSGLLRVGGLLLVDNTMYKGEELAGGELTANGAGAKACNIAMLEDDRVHQVMIPLRDGLTAALRVA